MVANVDVNFILEAYRVVMNSTATSEERGESTQTLETLLGEGKVPKVLIAERVPFLFQMISNNINRMDRVWGIRLLTSSFLNGIGPVLKSAHGPDIESHVQALLSSLVRDKHPFVRGCATKCLLNMLANGGTDSERLRLNFLKDATIVEGV